MCHETSRAAVLGQQGSRARRAGSAAVRHGRQASSAEPHQGDADQRTIKPLAPSVHPPAPEGLKVALTFAAAVWLTLAL